jgi:ATP/maltotriose-dependent transcriptional regulator MalT
MAQWRDELVGEGLAVAWLTVDRDDNNAVRFLSHLVDAVAAIEFLLDAGCHRLRLVVGSRSRSGLPVSRMRVRDELCEINAAALSFDALESRSFFSGAGGYLHSSSHP